MVVVGEEGRDKTSPAANHSRNRDDFNHNAWKGCIPAHRITRSNPRKSRKGPRGVHASPPAQLKQ